MQRRIQGIESRAIDAAMLGQGAVLRRRKEAALSDDIVTGSSGRGAAGGDVRFSNVPSELVASCHERIAELIEQGSPARPLLVNLRSALSRERLALPVISTTLTRVLRLLENDSVEISELALAVESDPALATKIVGVANSSFYGGIESVGSVEDALMRTGLEQAKNVVAGVAIRSSIFKAPGYERVVDAMWQRSIATAFAALALLETNPRWRDSAFLLGLVHDVGRIVMLATAAVPLARKGRVYSDEVIEEVGGAIRCELGAIALAAWIFDDEMVDAVSWQERPDLCPEASQGLCSGLYAADTIVNLTLRGWIPTQHDEVDQRVLELLAPLGYDLQQCAEIVLLVESGMSAFTKLV